MPLTDEWNIEKPLGQCCGTGQKIQPGQEYIAALVQTDQGLQRRDYCIQFWDQHKPPVYCYWKTRLPTGEPKKQLFIDDGMLMAFFERLAEETDPEKLNFRFVLALVLMRRRRLKYDSTYTVGGQDIWRLRITGTTDDFVEVVDPHLSEEQIEQLSSQITQILRGQL